MCCGQIVFVPWIIFFTTLVVDNAKVSETAYYNNSLKLSVEEYHKHVVNKFFAIRENWTTSVLGSVLFKNKKYPEIDPARKNKTHHILIWNNIHELLSFVFGEKSTKQYLSRCSVKNCIFYGDTNYLNISDAVVINVRYFGSEPRIPFRYQSQRFIFYTAESPVHTFVFQQPKLLRIAYRLNWSMTYRTDSDIPIPYGRVVPLEKPKKITTLESISKLVPFWTNKTKRVLVAAMISNCYTKYRQTLVRSLRRYIVVHYFGRCGDRKCQNLFKGLSCLRHYHFYLALENSLCRQYITEKVFVNAYSNGAIPIIKGPPGEDYAKLLPPNSYILVDNFKSVADLAREIIAISENNEKLLSYHIWRAHFKVISENGFFGEHPIAFCRLCEAMNYNSLQRSVYTYDDIKLHLEPKILCDLNETIFKPTAAPPPRYCYRIKSGNCINL